MMPNVSWDELISRLDEISGEWDSEKKRLHFLIQEYITKFTTPPPLWGVPRDVTIARIKNSLQENKKIEDIYGAQDYVDVV